MLSTKILCEYDKIDDTVVFEKKQYEETKGSITNQYLLLSVSFSGKHQNASQFQSKE